MIRIFGAVMMASCSQKPTMAWRTGTFITRRSIQWPAFAFGFAVGETPLMGRIGAWEPSIALHKRRPA
jgi:hypothetical protein